MGSSRRVGIHKLDNDDVQLQDDELAVECLVHLTADSVTIASLLASPTQLRELFVGHAYAEGYGDVRSELFTVNETDTGSVLINMEKELQRRESSERVVTSSCGACNADGLDEMIASLRYYSGPHPDFSHEILFSALEQMKSQQVGFQKTGGMHAAALWNEDTGLRFVSEDIGRHNAVDKAIGAALLNNCEPESHFLLLSGRCGWDLVAKASRSGVGTIVCIGACSTLAADTARNLGMRIFSFMKQDSNVGIGVMR